MISRLDGICQVRANSLGGRLLEVFDLAHCTTKQLVGKVAAALGLRAGTAQRQPTWRRNGRLPRLFRDQLNLRPTVIACRFALLALPREHGARFCQRAAAGGEVGRIDLEFPRERADDVAQLECAAG